MAKNNKEQLPDVPETMEDYMLQQLKKTVILKDGNTLKAEKEQSQESVGADSNNVAPAPTLSDPVQVEKPKQPQQLSLW